MTRRPPSGLRNFAFLGTMLVLGLALFVQACTQRDVVGVNVGTLAVAPDSAQLLEGDSLDLVVTVSDDRGSVLPSSVVEWSSQDPSVASVNSDGRVEALQIGNAWIRATYRGTSDSAYVQILPAPDVGITTTELSFFGAAGNTPPAPHVLNITNGGAGTLTGLQASAEYTDGEPADWLALPLASPTAPTTLTVTPQTAGLPSGRYSAIVTVSSPVDRTGPVTIPVTLSLTGFTVTESAGGTLVTEPGGTDSLVVFLDSQPTSDVVLCACSGDEGEVLVSPDTLTFTPSNWSTPQIVTLTGVDDSDNDGNQFTGVTIAVVPGASDPQFAMLPARTITVTTVDDDSPAGITIETGGAVIVDESGTQTDRFTAVLDAQPLADVVLTVLSQDVNEANISPATLRFTPANWNVPQSVTVTGVDDDVIDGLQSVTILVSVDGSQSHSSFHGLSESVPVDVLDDDVAGFTLQELGGTNVNESGTSDLFTMRLDAEPASPVVIAVESTDLDEASVDPDTLTFTPANWDVPQTVLVSGVDDALDDGDVVTAVRVEVIGALSDPAFAGLSEQILVTTVDDDGVGFSITETGGSTVVTEAGGQDSVMVRLNAQPTTDVVLLTLSTDTDEATVSPSTLTFTAADWSTPQIVTVAGVDDLVDDRDQNTVVTLSVDDVSSDPEYAGIVAQFLTVTIDDDDASIDLEDTAGLTVTEGGSSDVFTVVLGSEPLTNVVVDIVSLDVVEVSVSPASLTFGPGNWSTPQAVTLSGVDDPIDDDDQATLVRVRVNAAASDDRYDPVPDQFVTVTTVDDDQAGITLAGSDGLQVSESGTSSAFTVVLDAQPVTNVTLELSSSDVGEVSVSPNVLTFTQANWSTPKTVTLTGVSDNTLDGSQVSTITLDVDDVTSDAAFAGLSAAATVTTLDANVADFSLTELGGTRVSESGSTDIFTVVLSAQPAGDVFFSITSDDVGEAIVSPATLAFTAVNWSTPQSVTVTGQNDPEEDGDQTTTVTVAVTGGDPLFAGLSRTLDVTTTDDDQVGFTIVEIGSTIVRENGASDDFTIALNAAPTSDVTINLASSDPDEASVTPASVTFTSANWNQTQVVTVIGVDDVIIDGSQDTNITITVAAGSDALYSGLSAIIVATTLDDDVAGFNLEGTSGLSVSESGTTAEFTAVLSAQPATPVTLTVTSLDANETTVSPASLVFAPGAWNTPLSVTLTGANDALVDGPQSTTVRVQVNAGASDVAFGSVGAQTLSVTTEDDDVASLLVAATGSGTVVGEAGSPSDTLTVRLGAQPQVDVVVLVEAAAPDEASVSPTAITFTPTNWSIPQDVIVTGADDVIDDGDQITDVSFTVDIANSDDAFDGLDEVVQVTTVDNDTASFILGGTAGLSVNESGTSDDFTVVLGTQPVSNVVFSVTSTDAGEVSIQTPTRMFTPGNWNQPQTVSVRGVNDFIDDSDQVTTVTVAVLAGSSDDAFDAVSDQSASVTTVDDDVAALILADTAALTVDESGTSNVFTLRLQTQPVGNVVVSTSPIDAGEVSISPATLTFTPSTWSEPQAVTVTGANDNVIDGPQTTPVTLAVTSALADAPYVGRSVQSSITTTDDDGASLVIAEQGGTRVNEAGGTDNFGVSLGAQPASDVVITVASSDTGEATVDPTTLTFTQANWNAEQIVTVTGVNDALDDGDQVTTVTITVVDAQSDAAFAGLADSVSVTTTDDDGAGILIEEFGGVTVSENATTAVFAVRLTAQPATSNVVLNVSSGDIDEATVSPSTLTFTTGNWSNQQLVTVTGVGDSPLVDGGQGTTVTLSVNTAASDDGYDAVPVQTVVATTTDRDLPGFSVSESSLTVAEDGTGNSATFEVELTAQPVDPVVITLANPGAGNELTLSASQLTFTDANWNAAQTVTATGFNDTPLVDGTQQTVVTVSVNDGLSGPLWAAVGDQQVTVTTTDTDVAGFTFASTGLTTVTENGTTDMVSVVLTAQPVNNVVFNISSGDTGEATVSPASLTFTNANWNATQFVTVTGVNDGSLVDGSQVTTLTASVNDGQSDSAWDPLADQTLTATTTDNDVAGFAISHTLGTTTVSENGTTDQILVVLTAQPLADVVFNISSDDTGETTVAPTSLTFTNANWNIAQFVTVTGVNDGSLVDGSQVTTLTVSVNDGSSDNAWDPLGDQTLNATTNDNDVPGFTLGHTSGSTTVSESGSTDQFSVVLTTQPLTDVVLNISSGDTGEATISPAALTFTNTSWSTQQFVTVTGANDGSLVDGDQITTLTVSIADASSDSAWDPLPDETLTATTTDNDAAGFTVSHTSGSTSVSESESTDQVSVVLTAQPLTNVVLNVSSDDTGEATVGPASLTFTNANWSTEQFVTVTGVDDGSLVDGSQATAITVSVNDGLSDNAWDPVADQSLNATTTDNDVADYMVAHTNGNTTVTEGGTTDSISVVLTAQPVTNVVFNVSSGDTGEATVSPASLTFTNINWNTPQFATVTGADDGTLVDGDQVTTVTVSVNDGSSDNAWDPLVDQTLGITTADNDAAGLTISHSNGVTTISEDGTTDTISVVLTAQPLTNVVLSISSGDTGEATVTPSLTFTNANWSTAQVVTVTGADDGTLVDGSQVTTLTVSVNDGSSDNAWDPLADQTLTATTTDNDAAGFTIAHTSGTTIVSEDATTDSISVVLTAQPLTDVVVSVSSGDAGEAALAPLSLTFTTANWSTTQFVAITGVDDGVLVDGDQITTLTATINDGSSDNAWDPLADQTVTVTTADNDAAGFAMTHTSGSTTVSESGSTDEILIVLTAQPLTDVVFDISSGDTGEATVAPTSLTFTNTNWSTAQFVTVTGVDDGSLVDGSQITTLTVSVNDGASDNAWDLSSDQTLQATTTDNDVAEFTLTHTNGSTTVAETGTSDSIAVVLTAQPAADVVFTISSGDMGEATVTPTSLTFTTANWNVQRFVTVTGVNDGALVDGSQSITLTASVDDGLSDNAWDPLASQTIQATTADNDVASFTITQFGGTTAVAEALGPNNVDSISVVLSAQPVGNVAFQVSSADLGEFRLHAVDPTVELTFNGANWNVPQMVDVFGVTDNDLVDGDQVALLSVAVDGAQSDNAWDALATQTVSVTVDDTDIAGIVAVHPGGGVASAEEGGPAEELSVTLRGRPIGNVTITVLSQSPTLATVNVSTLTFTNSDWNVPQVVEVTAVNDAVDETDINANIIFSINDPMTDDLWDALEDELFPVLIIDNDP